MLNSYEIEAGLIEHGFKLLIDNAHARGFTHPRMREPVFVKYKRTPTGSIAVRERPLVLHPNALTQCRAALELPGVELGEGPYHNANMRGFPKRKHTGVAPIFYGWDVGVSHETTLDVLLDELLRLNAMPAGLGPAEAAPDDPLPASLNETERDALIKARIGQSQFRGDLLAFWGGCAVTECTVPELLRASHIKPWRMAVPAERLDVFNGLLLTPNLDLAFDQGLISFSDSGEILLSDELDDASQCALGLNAELRLREVEPAHHPYLAWHRQHLFRS